MLIKEDTSQNTISPGLFNPHNSPNTFQITSAVGGSLSTLTPRKDKKLGSGTSRIGGGDREAVRGLSDSSRLRFLRELAKINFSKIKGRALFVTLTFPKDKWSPDHKNWKRNLQKLKQRLDRKYGKISGFWRLELHSKDGSLHPHFHSLMVLSTNR